MNLVKVEQARDVTDPTMRERVKQGQSPRTEEFVVVVNGQEAGLLILESTTSDLTGVVYEIYVLEPFRRAGVGQHLLSHAETLGREKGWNVIRLMPRSLDRDQISDQVLKTWYYRNGFRPDPTNSSWMQKNLGLRM